MTIASNKISFKDGMGREKIRSKLLQCSWRLRCIQSCQVLFTSLHIITEQEFEGFTVFKGYQSKHKHWRSYNWITFICWHYAIWTCSYFAVVQELFISFWTLVDIINLVNSVPVRSNKYLRFFQFHLTGWDATSGKQIWRLKLRQ